MRALLVGIGGAGSRIVNMLSAHEEKSSVKSVRAYIFDADHNDLNSMEAIDPDKRIYLSPSSVETEECLTGSDFDLGHISGYFDDAVADEADAIFICAGLGGRMAETVPEILRQLNVTFADPVYTLLTLPARSEGARVSARAAATLSEIREEANASILFDNETWIQRLEEAHDTRLSKKQDKKEGENDACLPAKLSIQETKEELNELLTRRVELLLRAGEITPNGLESADAVLDAGEVLNTLTNSDIVSIGYAAERIPKNLLGFFNRFRMEKYLLEEGHKRTARIVELAKQAVYEEVSVPCDLTTANKALILITGPSNELSMKGFQTIRKWIDRSIKGLEMRAGDYPVHSSQDVGVIIVLAGIENVPRLAELNEIKTSYDEEVRKKYHGVNDYTNEIIEPKLRPAADKEIFEEVEVLSMYRDVPFLEPVADVPELTPANNITSADTSNYTPETQEVNPYDNIDIWEIETENTELFGQDTPAAGIEYPDSQQGGKTDTPGGMKAEQVNTPEYGDVFEEIPVPGCIQESADVFEDTPITDSRRRDEDFFEEHPISAEQQPAYYPSRASYTENTLMPDSSAASGTRNPVAKISLGAKGRKVEPDEKIPLPPRNKQPDMVLSGQADLGMRKITKDTEDRVSLGSGQKPKETDGRVSVGSGQKPKETDGRVSVGSGQRPKETDGRVSVGTGQKPKETDGRVSVGSGQKPKETDGRVSVGSGQRPKDTDGRVSVGSGQRPKETDGRVSVGSGQRPKDTDGRVSVGSGQRPKDTDGAVSTGSKQRPKDTDGAVRLGTGQRPKEIGNVVRIGSAPKPKEAGTVIKVSRKQPAKETLNPVRTVQKKTETKEEKTSGTAHDIKWN